MIEGLPYDVLNKVPFTRFDGPLGSKLYLVNTESEWRAFYDLLMQRKLVACDTETSGFHWFKNKHIVGMSFGWNDTHFYIPVRHEDSCLDGEQPPQLSMDFVREDLKKFFAQKDVTTIYHHGKFDMHFYRADGIEILTPFHDTRILWQLFDENAPGALKTIASGWKCAMTGIQYEGLVGPEADEFEKELSKWRGKEATARRTYFRKLLVSKAAELAKEIEFQGWNKKDIKQHLLDNVPEFRDHPYRHASKEDVHYGFVPIRLMTRYAATDTFLTYKVYEHVMKNLSFNKQLKDLYINEIKLSKALMEAEETGVKIDRPYLENLEEELNREIEILEYQIKEELGQINLNSPGQLGHALYNYGCKLTKRTEGGNYSTDAKVLNKLAEKHDVVQKILDLRAKRKLRDTYVRSILEKLTDDDILHCQFNQNVSTGRMCIAQGSLIQMPCNRAVYPNGKPIEDVKVGDYVYCYDEQGNLYLRKVLWAGFKGRKKTVQIRWQGQGNKSSGSLELTPDHRVRLFDGSWIEAQNLKPGDRIMSLSSGIKSNHRVIEVTEGHNEAAVYDLEVEEYNNFIANDLCVHNSSSDPNLQNIPGRDDRIRKAFIRPGDEFYYVFADYSQVEVRLTAHYSHDRLLLDAYRKKQDIHTRTMCEMFGFEYEEAMKILDDENHPDHKKLKNLRTIAKRINFGIIYGVGAPGLSEQIPRPDQYKKKTQEQWVKICQQYIDQYMAKYLGVKRFVNQSGREIRKNCIGYNHFGRPRRLPWAKADTLLGEDKYWMVGRAKRQFTNFLIQGTAADLFKIAVVRVHELFEREATKSKIVNFVHDEIQMYIHKDELFLLNKVRTLMEDFDFIVPIVADFAWSVTSWGDKKELG